MFLRFYMYFDERRKKNVVNTFLIPLPMKQNKGKWLYVGERITGTLF